MYDIRIGAINLAPNMVCRTIMGVDSRILEANIRLHYILITKP